MYYRKIMNRLKIVRRNSIARNNLKTVNSPPSLQGYTGVTAVCLIKDGAYWIKDFLKHHRAIGIGRFIFVDNGSMDSTRETLLKEPDVILLTCSLSPYHYEARMRREAAWRFCKGQWCLFVDADEMFELPLLNNTSIDALTHHLDSSGCTGLVSHMLDMFPEEPIIEWQNASYNEAISGFKYCNINDMVRYSYHDKSTPLYDYLITNSLSNEEISVFSGGVRLSVFSENPFLTKHPLVKLTGDAVPMQHVHVSTHLRISSLTSFIRHYKFAGNFLEKDMKSVAANTWKHSQDKRRIEGLQKTPRLSLMTQNAQLYNSKVELAQQGFIRVTP